ncbi:MAG TPA: flagellar motor protein MotD [Steroidobacteraceae bacterium]|nr:flagellar motor protein MotD [Steroidobacteraceae bacterium]
MSFKPRKRHEEHTNHEAWAIPYGDLITLLLAFFVVMYALSTLNEGKYRLLSDSLYAAFRGEPRTLEPVEVGQHQAGAGADSRTGVLQQQRSDPARAPPAGPLVKLAPEVPQIASSRATALAAQAERRDAALTRVADQVQNALGDLVKRNLVTVRRNDMWVEVELRTDILFTSGSAQPAPTAVPVLERLAQVLAPLPNAIRVEGYTDNVPIRTSVFYSNWELSAARAGSVVRVLAGQGIDASRLAVVGYGEQRPAQSNDSPEGRNANRRVVVVILAVEPRNDAPADAAAPADAGAPVAAASAAAAPAPAGTVQSVTAASPTAGTPAAAPPAASPAAPLPASAAPAMGADGGH